jgi:DEAD/DEAH box helicase domain-containing protein
MWNPPLIDKASGTRARRSPRRRSCWRAGLPRGADDLLPQKPARDRADPALRREALERRGKPELAARIAPYRGGYTPQQRREIEARPGDGELLAVVATDALELGIDVGELDAAICVTFPGTWPACGRCGDGPGGSGAGSPLYVAGQDALDQFFCRHPDEFLGRPVEAAILDHGNEQIASRHLIAAAYELPLSRRGRRGLRRGLARAGRAAGVGGELRAPAGGLLPRSSEFVASRSPALGLGRLGGGDRARLPARCSAWSRPSAPSPTVHPAPSTSTWALLRGRAARRRGRRAIVSRFDGDWYTRPKKETEIYIERVREQRTTAGSSCTSARSR